MTKNIFFKIKGVIKVRCIVSSRKITRKYTGSAQIKKASDKRDLFKRAILDCVYQHMKNGGSSTPKVVILDYKMKYLGEDNLIKIKRVKRRGKYYTYVTDRRTNKIITYKKWGYERNLQKFV